MTGFPLEGGVLCGTVPTDTITDEYPCQRDWNSAVPNKNLSGARNMADVYGGGGVRANGCMQQSIARCFHPMPEQAEASRMSSR